ncbi:hypothetical protein M422DRAFT_242171, partial [Sphaerobolus stellatus SS14]
MYVSPLFYPSSANSKTYNDFIRPPTTPERSRTEARASERDSRLMTSPSDRRERIQEKAAHRLQNSSPPPPQPFSHLPTTRQQENQRNTDGPFAPPNPQIHELFAQALNRSRETVADIRAQAEAARAAIPAPPRRQAVPIPQPPVAVGSAAIAALRQQAYAVNLADIRAQAEVARAAIPPPPRRQGVSIPQPPLPQPPVAASRQQTDAVNVAYIRAQAEAARAAIPPLPPQQGVPIPQPPVAVGSTAIAALRQQADGANQQLLNTTAQRRQWENPRLPSLPPAPALRRPAMLPPLPDPPPHFDHGRMPPPQQHLLIDDRNHPDGFLARTPNQPHAPHLDIRIKTHYLGRMDARCEHCNALHWLEERVLYMGSQLNPKFGLCCDHGQVNLPSPPSPPLELLDLFKDNSSVGKEFRENIRRYNSAFAFISLGCKLNAGMERSGGPYSFRVDGELYHMVGSLLPEP